MNDRLDLPGDPPTWDVMTPEQRLPSEGLCIKGRPVVWESCQTFSGAWGYHRDEQSWRSVRQLITSLIDCVSKGGNLLLNVGPTGRGEFDSQTLDRLSGIGQWMYRHNRSIYGCTQAPSQFPSPNDCRLTYHPGKKRLYIHLLNWPYNSLHLESEAFVKCVDYAQFLHDASEITLESGSEDWNLQQQSRDARKTLTLNIPLHEPKDVAIPVIELFLKDPRHSRK